MIDIWSLDLGDISVIVNSLSLLGVLFVMQRITNDFSTYSTLGWVKMAHRGAFILLAMALAYNIYRTVDGENNPRFVDLLVQIGLMLTVAVSFVRHGMASTRNRAAQLPPVFKNQRER